MGDYVGAQAEAEASPPCRHSRACHSRYSELRLRPGKRPTAARIEKHEPGRLQRPPGPQRLPAHHRQTGRPLHRLHRPPRRRRHESAHRQAGAQRHVHRRRHRSRPAQVPRAHPWRARQPPRHRRIWRRADGAHLHQSASRRQKQVLPAAQLRRLRARNLGCHRPRQARPPHRD